MAKFSRDELIRRAARAYSTARGVLASRRKRAHADGRVTRAEADKIHEAERNVAAARKHLAKRKAAKASKWKRFRRKLSVQKSPIVRHDGYGSLGEIRRVAVHHDAGVIRFTMDSVRKMIRAYDTQHMNQYGGGIGYHEIIDGRGRIWRTRSSSSKGAHVAGNNTNTYGIMLTGNFEERDTPTKAQLDTLHIRLTQAPPAGLPDLRNKKPYGHKEIVNNSACPGRRLLPWVQEFRSKQ